MVESRILIVEDQLEARRVLCAGLESLEKALTVIAVPSGEEALLVLDRQKIDLLVIDVRLAGMSGLELMQKVRQRNPAVKVILITGLTDPRTRETMEQAGVAAVFYKPIRLAEFLEAVQKTLEIPSTEQTSPPREEVLPSLSVPEPSISLPDLLVNLREALEAQAVILLDTAGLVLAHAGSTPQDFNQDAVIPKVMTLWSAASALSHALEQQPPEDFVHLIGRERDYILAHCGEAAALFVITDGHLLPARRATASEFVREAAQKISSFLAESTTTPTNAGEAVARLSEMEAEGEEARPEDVEALEELFQQAAQLELGGQDVDQFWESLVTDSDADETFDTGSLSYDQARRLGLAPDEDES